jgi:repressor LexA
MAHPTALTRRQRQVLDFITEFTRSRGFAPSLEEIAAHMGFASVSNAHQHVSALERRGHIRRDPNKSRALQVVSPAEDERRELPLLGYVAAGEPIEVVETREMFPVTPDLLRRADYVLRVRGDSMIDEQIRDGDYIVVRSRETADNGEVVVALVGGTAATVKKFYREAGDRVRLQPANPAMDALVLPASDLIVQGVVTGVIRVL